MSVNLPLVTKAGAVKGTQKASAVFESPVNKGLIHRAVVMRLANARNPIAHTKTRGEVAATTKKAFRQKGTGRARRGALSTNLLRGGGVTHGPRNTRNFTKQLSKKERRIALFSALSAKHGEGRVYAMEDLGLESPSTKAVAAVRDAFAAGEKVVFLVGKEAKVFQKSARNIERVRVMLASYVNPYDVLWADHVCFVGDGLALFEQTFTSTK